MKYFEIDKFFWFALIEQKELRNEVVVVSYNTFH